MYNLFILDVTSVMGKDFLDFILYICGLMN